MSKGPGTERLAEDTQVMLQRYLLGELDDEEKDQIEERYFSDDTFYTQLLLVEDELLDSYVLGELPRGDQAKFVEAYINDFHRVKKVESNRILLKAIEERCRVYTPIYQRWRNSLARTLSSWNVAPRYSFAALGLVTIVSCGVLIWSLAERRRMSNELQQAHAQWQEKENNYQRRLAELQLHPSEPSPSPSVREETGKPEEHLASGERPGEKRPGAPPAIAFALNYNVVRGLGSSIKPLIIPRGTVLVRLKVDIEQNDFQSYNVSLQQVAGVEVWRQTLSKAAATLSATQLKVDLPASVFANGDYFLKITASHPGSKEETLALQQIKAINHNRSTDNTIRR